MSFTNASTYKGAKGEVFALPSKTVPDMSLSIRDLFERHKSGGRSHSFTPVYCDDSVPAGLERMDAIERKAYANELADFISTTRGQIISNRAARQQAAADAAFKSAVAAGVAASAASSTSDVLSEQAEGSGASRRR